MPTTTFRVPDMRCEGCERSIRDALDVTGVRDVDIALADGTVSVDYDAAEVAEDDLARRIKERGFSPAAVDAAREQGDAGSAGSVDSADGPGGPGGPSGPSGSGAWYAFLAAAVAAISAAAYAGYAFYPRFDLPVVEGVGLLLLAVGAGVASFFSPCAFPLLVTLLARETGVGEGRRGTMGRGLRFALALSGGAALFLLIVGAGIGVGGGALFSQVTFTSTAGIVLRIVIGALLILLGLIQLGVIPAPLHAVEAVSRPLLRKQAETRRSMPVAGGAVFGFGYLLAGFG